MINNFKNLHLFKWKLIFFQNAELQKPFTKDKVLFCPNTDGSKYSSLGSISDRYKIEDYFAFFLEYHFEEIDPTYIYWKQKINPLETEPGDTDLSFVPLSMPNSSDIKEGSEFKGLAKSFDYQSFLDGTPGNQTKNWWYSIGEYYFYPSESTIPGPRYVDEPGATKVYLWIRIPFGLSCSERFFLTRKFILLNFIFIIILC